MTDGTVWAVPDERVLQPRGKDSMRREQTTTKAASYPAIALAALLMLTLKLPLLAQPTNPTRPLDDAAMHPVPALLQQPPATNDAQADCQPATLIARLRQRYMPHVRGCTLDIVEGSFKRADRGPAKAVRQPSDLPSGVVSSSDPPADTQLPSSTQVTLFVSTGPGPKPPSEGIVPPAAIATMGPKPKKQAMTTVPLVRGYAVASAVEAINGRHLVPIPGGSEFSEEPVGSVSHTDPPAEKRVLQDTPVTYWTSLGKRPSPPPPPQPPLPHMASVPSVTGVIPSDALVILRKASLTAGKPIPELSLAGTGRISRQDPPAGSHVPRGTMVLLWWPYAWLSVTGLVVIPLLILGFAAGLLLRHVRAKRRLACTRAVLHIRPSLTHDGGTQLVGATPSIGRTLALRASLHPGEVRFTDPVSIERQEIQHD